MLSTSSRTSHYIETRKLDYSTCVFGASPQTQGNLVATKSSLFTCVEPSTVETVSAVLLRQDTPSGRRQVTGDRQPYAATGGFSQIFQDWRLPEREPVDVDTRRLRR